MAGKSTKKSAASTKKSTAATKKSTASTKKSATSTKKATDSTGAVAITCTTEQCKGFGEYPKSVDYLKDIKQHSKFYKHILNNAELLNFRVPEDLRNAPPVRDLAFGNGLKNPENMHTDKWVENILSMFAYVTGKIVGPMTPGVRVKKNKKGEDEGEDDDGPAPGYCKHCSKGLTKYPYCVVFDPENGGDVKGMGMDKACCNCIYNHNTTRCSFYKRTLKGGEESEGDEDSDVEDNNNNTSGKGKASDKRKASAKAENPKGAKKSKK